MKRHISTFLAIFLLAALLPAQLLATAKDVNISQKNASDSAWTNVVISPTANSLLAFNGSKVPISTVAPTGITSIGVNTVLSAAGQPLTFQTGTFGTGLSFASATGAGTFAVAPTAPDYLLGTSGPSVSSSLSSRAQGQGMAFSGVVPAPVAALTAPGTGDFAVALTANQSESKLAYILDDATGSTNILYVDADGYCIWWTAGALRVKSSIPLVYGKETNIVISRAAGVTTMYFDCAVVGSEADVGNFSSAIVTIGGRSAGAGSNFNGTLRNFTPYNYALTGAQVKSLAEHGVSPSDFNGSTVGTTKTLADATVVGGSTNVAGTATYSGNNQFLVIDNVYTVTPLMGGKTLISFDYTVTTPGIISSPAYANVDNFCGNTAAYVSATANGSYSQVVETTRTGKALELKSSAGFTGTITNLNITPLGALAAYSDTQPGLGTKYYDVSGHGADITLPAGVSWAHPSSLTTPLGGGATWSSGTGSPESAVTAPVGSMYTRTDGGASTTLYVKETGTGATGWVAPGPVYGTLYKADSGTPVFTKTGAGTISIKAGTVVVINNVPQKFATATAATLDTGSLAAGTDYAIYCTTAGTLLFSASPSAPSGYTTANTLKIGGFHYAPGGNATAQAGGDTTPAINVYSIWDLKWRPRCDPRGMALVANSFWCDIYLANSDPDTNGSSRYAATIADSTNVVIPSAFGGNTSTTYTGFNWWAASELGNSVGKQLLDYGDFCAATYGVTEGSSLGYDTNTTTLDAPRTSKWGIQQATGNMLVWGKGDNNNPLGAGDTGWKDITESRGKMYLFNDGGIKKPLFGGHWDNGVGAGSRSVNWTDSPSASSNSTGVRFRCDHLSLP